MIFGTEPLARGVDPASDAGAQAQQAILRAKPSLNHFYLATYEAMVRAATDHLNHSDGVVLELGSGGGFLSDVVPGLVTSDVKRIPGVDMAVDARNLPFDNDTIDIIYGMHVLHHIPDVQMFLDEVARAVRRGGGVVLVEPYWSPMARFLYRFLHPEPWEPHATSWAFEGTGPDSSNQAMSLLMLELDAHVFRARNPQLEIIREKAFGGPSYVISGGIWKRSLLRQDWLIKLWDLEERTDAWRSLLALHHLFVIRRR